METCEFSLPFTCRYIIAAPEKLPSEPVIVLTLHGYGSTPETMLRLTVPTVEPDVVVASLQAPNQHYTGDGPSSGVAGYNWGIRHHHADSVRMHHAMVLKTLGELQTRFGVGPRRFEARLSEGRIIDAVNDVVGHARMVRMAKQ